jgi:hypothetical protein
MEMSNRTLRDGIILIGAFHFLLAFLSLVGAVGIYFYGIAFITYMIVGVGVIRQSNSARIGAIFLSLVGIMSGFIAVLGALAVNVKDAASVSLASTAMTGLIFICGYSILAFLDIFILIFLFNNQIRDIFYREE